MRSIFIIMTVVTCNFYTLSLDARRKPRKKKKLTLIEQVEPTKKQSPRPEELIHDLLQPVQFSQDGLKKFIQQYNTSFYVERFLPACFIHLVDFMEFGEAKEKNIQYFLSVLALFTQRVQACEWVNPYALLALMERMGEIIKTECLRAEDQDIFNQIQSELKKSLIERFDLLKEKPEEFLQSTTQKIVTAIEFSNSQYAVRELQAAVTNFLLVTISKLIWHPREKIDSWRMMVAMANQIQSFFENHLIASYEDLNLLMWSLLYRYGYFIECAGSQLSPDIYKVIQNELQEKKHSFLLLREQEAEMTSKENYLMSTIMKGITKAEAYTSGISVDRFI